MTIKQLGGVFGRNPTFNDVTIEGTLTFDGDIDINSDLKVDGDLDVTGGMTVDTDTLVVDAANNRVGIGTSSPANGAKLHSAGAIISTDATLATYNFNNAGFDFVSGTKVARFFATSTDTTGGVMTFITGQNASYGERMRIDSSGALILNPNNATRGLKITTTQTTAVGDTTTYDTIGAGYGRHIFKTDGVEAMRIDSSGNVGIGTSTNLANGTLNVESNGTSVLQARSDTAGVNDGDTTVVVSRALNSTAGKWANAIYRGYTHAWSYGSSAGSNEAMRIDSSGNLLIGTTSGSFSAKITAENASSYNFESSRTGTGSEGHVVFRNGNGAVGSIFTNGLATVYNTSSDQRLKSNIVDAPSASDDIDAIQVRSFDWKADGSHQKYGMVAQELVTVAPQAVSQPEDPEEMMGVDYSKLVPMLIKEVQQLRARVAQLEGVN